MPEETNRQDSAEKKQPSDLPAENQTTENTDEELNLPEDAPERTKEQFEKLKQRNKELSEKLRQREETSSESDIASVYDALRPKTEVPIPDATQLQGVNQKQVDDLYKELTNEDGYINEEALKRSLTDITKQAQDAIEAAKRASLQVQSIEEKAQTREAYKEFPQLNPKSKQFDQRFYNAVKNELIGQMMNGEKDLMKAARTAADLVHLKDASSEQAKKVEEKSRKDEQIQQGSPSSGTNKPDRFKSIDNNELIQASRKNVRGAIAERLRRSGY